MWYDRGMFQQMDFSQTSTWIILGIILGVTLISMILHELMHGLTAHWLGDNTAKEAGRLTLNPIKHIDPIMTILLPLLMAATGGPIFGGAKPVPFNPERVRGREWGSALVGIMGPITNLLLSFIAYCVVILIGGKKFLIIPELINVTTFSGALMEFLVMSVYVNLGFFAFNILPIPPLDGSRVLYAVAPPAVQRAMDIIEHTIGLMIVFLIVCLFATTLNRVMLEIINGVLAGFQFILS